MVEKSTNLNKDFSNNHLATTNKKFSRFYFLDKRLFSLTNLLVSSLRYTNNRYYSSKKTVKRLRYLLNLNSKKKPR
jgi:hypothetical protein